MEKFLSTPFDHMGESLKSQQVPNVKSQNPNIHSLGNFSSYRHANKQTKIQLGNGLKWQNTAKNIFSHRGGSPLALGTGKNPENHQ